MTSRFVKGWFIGTAAATLLAAAGARAEEPRMDAKPGDAHALRVARAYGAAGSAAPADVADCACVPTVASPKADTSSAKPSAAPAAGDRARNADYDDAREVAAGNSGGRG